MTAARLRINVLLVALATSYLTLGLANEGLASKLWWAYAIATGSLAGANLVLGGRE
jgi:hypothetical protein